MPGPRATPLVPRPSERSGVVRDAPGLRSLPIRVSGRAAAVDNLLSRVARRLRSPSLGRALGPPAAAPCRAPHARLASPASRGSSQAAAGAADCSVQPGARFLGVFGALRTRTSARAARSLRGFPKSTSGLPRTMLPGVAPGPDEKLRAHSGTRSIRVDNPWEAGRERRESSGETRGLSATSRFLAATLAARSGEMSREVPLLHHSSRVAGPARATSIGPTCRWSLDLRRDRRWLSTAEASLC